MTPTPTRPEPTTPQPSDENLRYALKDLRNPAFAESAPGKSANGFVVWYDHGKDTMQWLHDNYGLDFTTPHAECCAIADKLEQRLKP